MRIEDAVSGEPHDALSVRAAVCALTAPRVEMAPGVEVGLLERSEEHGLRLTFLIQLAPGAGAVLEDRGAYDLFVLGGTVKMHGRHHVPHDYAGFVQGERVTLSAGAEGALLFGKNRPSMRPRRVMLATGGRGFEPSHTPGLSILRLDEQPDGRVVLLRFAPHTTIDAHRHQGGEEFFILEGVLRDEGGVYSRHWWVRQPPESVHTVTTLEGCLMLTTAGHLSPG